LRLFYLSFCSPAGWLGAAFVEAHGVVSATKRAGDEGIAPSGNEVKTLAFGWDGLIDVPAVPENMRNRRLGREELVELWPDAVDFMEYDDHV
jgi:hypothetical protein